MAVPAGVIVGWPNTAASVPGGWVRTTALDDKYPKMLLTTGTNPGTTGGGATHTHTAPSHSHSVSHGHTSPMLPVSTPTPNNFNSSGGASASAIGHNHNATINTGADTASGSATWDAAASDPTYYTVVWIQSDGTPTGIPVGAVAYWNTQTPPTGWSQHSASRGAYLKGAPAGGNGAAPGGGNHSHTSATAHTHAGAGHTHTATVAADATSEFPPSGGVSGAAHPHTHTGTSGSTAVALDAFAESANATAFTDPPYTTLVHIQNSGGAASQPTGVICLWTGTLASIPAGWALASVPVDKFVKGAFNLTDVGLAGGALGHTHAAGAGHSHAQSAGHAHPLTVNTDGASIGLAAIAGSGQPVATHGHGTVTLSTDTTASSTTAMGTNSVADARPPYLEVAFIQFGGPMTVGITSPANGATVTTPNPTVAWTISGGRTQQDYRLFVYAADGVTVVYDSGRVAAAVQSASVPVGYLLSVTSYILKVVVDSTLAENAISPTISITTSWTNPGVVAGVVCTPVGGV